MKTAENLGVKAGIKAQSLSDLANTIRAQDRAKDLIEEQKSKNLPSTAFDKTEFSHRAKLEKLSRERLAELKDAKSSEIIKTAPARSREKPAIFFIRGMELFSSSDSYDGMDQMADALKDAKSFSWGDKSQILEEIRKTDGSFPVVLVGHSYGADTAVEVAQELNSLEEGFRKVDLLVTLDSVGFDNDIVPQNVKRNLNIIGDGSSWLNDGPNVAKDHLKTEVTNIIRAEGHRELDNSEDVQFEIVQAIEKTVLDAKVSRVSEGLGNLLKPKTIIGER